MARSCESCSASPSGLEGHEWISLHDGRTPEGRQLFRCRQCSTLWTRHYEGSGLFVWVESGRIEPAD